uniref:Uncharacterized protein n=1 Tax=Rhodococcus sp. NS1 TaxID=402236 RepID=A0A097SQD7_9NOCA|nr:hypothetical protein LRS1606.296 [Rhodococcus sp. NS1]
MSRRFLLECRTDERCDPHERSMHPVVGTRRSLEVRHYRHSCGVEEAGARVSRVGSAGSTAVACNVYDSSARSSVCHDYCVAESCCAGGGLLDGASRDRLDRLSGRLGGSH